ncbi:MAG: DUF1684 domain-containing protein [Cyclobacteriaceae bacterium]|nr:DUF1684 domain-containing protein [Cyclobacteriaceae bacterium]
MKYLWTVIIFISLFILGYTFFSSGGNDKVIYEQTILEEREKKAEFMENDPDSPFRKKGLVTFGGLKYFDPDPAFRVEAEVKLLEQPEEIQLTLNDGSQRKYFRYARAKFELSGIPQMLVLLKSEDYWNEDWVFLPFYDETSADETYGGGRYLEVPYAGGSTAFIDFNLSYNPYCAYTDTYLCPFPPPENQITVRVTAGEKLYSQDH